MASIQAPGPGPKPDLEIPMAQQKKKPSSGDDARRVDHIMEVAFNPVGGGFDGETWLGRLARLARLGTHQSSLSLVPC
jgi:hypothetical protein